MFHFFIFLGVKVYINLKMNKRHIFEMCIYTFQAHACYFLITVISFISTRPCNAFFDFVYSAENDIARFSFSGVYISSADKNSNYLASRGAIREF